MAYDKVVDSAALDTKLTSIADAIRAKTGGSAALTLDEMPNEIASIQTGGGGGSTAPVSANDVTFYDYDGTIVASYTLAQAQALTALPDAPTHDGLTFQGWNWSLENVNALTRPMNVGAMYITDDGKTRLYIHITHSARSTVPLYLQQTVANGVTINWGDGSAPETLAGTGNVNTSHAYGLAGDFTISLEVADVCKLGFCNNSSSYSILGSSTNNMLRSVNIGKNVASLNQYSFQYCYSLKSITIPSSIINFGDYAFYCCFSLHCITIPDGTKSISTSEFNYCGSLKIVSIPYSLSTLGSLSFQDCHVISNITIPSGVKNMYGGAMQNCYTLKNVTIPEGVSAVSSNLLSNCNTISNITIPSSVTEIYGNAFNSCYGVAEYHLKPTTPPTLSSTNAFTGIASDCIIYVPQGCLEAYQNATNWTTYASYMQEEP